VERASAENAVRRRLGFLRTAWPRAEDDREGAGLDEAPNLGMSPRRQCNLSTTAMEFDDFRSRAGWRTEEAGTFSLLWGFDHTISGGDR